MKLTGKKIIKGEYKGIQYAFIYLFCTYPIRDGGEGEAATKVKFKGGVDLFDQFHIGSEYRFFYDRYGNAVDFESVDIL